MRSVNMAVLLGHVGNDPDRRSTQGGRSVATFSLATNESWNDEMGVKQERVAWHRVVAWEGLAEVVGKYVRKGTQLYLRGRIDYRQWEDKDGKIRYSTEIVAADITLLGTPVAQQAADAREREEPTVQRSAARTKTRAKAAGAKKSDARVEREEGDDLDEVPF